MISCPICHSKIVRSCSCAKMESICENGHIFHFKLSFAKIASIKEIHFGAANHFSDNCQNCKIIK